MKKFFKSVILLASSALLLAGCAKEMQGPKGLDGDVQQVTFTASIPQEMTKAVADGDGAGASVNRCIMEIYYDGSLFKRDIQPVTHGTTITATFSAQVVANRTYTVAFWADCVTSTSALGTDLYYTTDATQPNGGLQAIALKGTYAGNDDKRDAFFAKESCTVAQGGTSFNVTLKRPFAQINVITTDWDKVATVSSLKPDKVDVTIQSPLSKFNAVTGEASADANVTSLNYNADLYTTPESGTDATLSMDYLFASADKAVIDIAWKAQKTGNTDVSHSFTNIPYQRNYRTNIKGALLTTTGQWNVTVDPVWESATEGEHNYEVVADIAGANTTIAAQVAAGEEVINIKFAQEPNDAGVPGTQSGELISKAIVTTDLPEDTRLNVLVESETKALYVGDYESETDATLATRDKEQAVVNITATATITTLVINAPSKTVYLNGEEVSSVGTITSVEATTSQNTLIVNKNQTITSLTVHQGGLEIHGTVGALVITETDHDNNPVKVRTSENLSQEVFNVIYKTGDNAHDYIDRPKYVEKVNETSPVTYDIILADPVAQIGETKYWSLADAVAAANQTTGATIELLENVSVSSALTISKDMTLDMNDKSVAITGAFNVAEDIVIYIKDGDFSGCVSLTGSGTADITNVDVDNSDGNALSSTSGLIIVNSGKFKGGLVTSTNGTIELYGGIYSVEPATTNASPAFGYSQGANTDSQTSAAYPWTIVANPAEDAEVSVAKTGTTTVYGTLAGFRDAVNAGNYFWGYTVTLLKDVTYSSENYWMPIGYMNGTPFCGTFDGNGHKVEGLNIDTYELDPSGNNKYWPGGFFGYTYNANIINLTLYGVTDCAGMVGYAWYTNITDCVSHMNSDLCYNISGGFVAHAQEYVTLTNCKNYGNFVCMTSANYAEVGGIVGRFYGGDHCSVTNCENYGNISWKGENNGGTQRSLGGIVAAFYNAGAISNPQKCVISGCKNYGVIYNKNATSGTTTTTLGGIGGIVGKPFLQANGIGVTISNCVNEGSVISSGRAGGIIGTLNEAWQNIGKFTTVSGCTNSGTVYGTDGSRGQIYGVMFTNTSDPGKDNVLSENTESGTLKAYEDYSE